jgi:hypothetical protein
LATTLRELAEQLPNGFHDMYVERMALDFTRRIAAFDVEVWVGEMSAGPELREATRNGELILEGLLFCVFEPPDVRYPHSKYAEAKPLWLVDLCDVDPALPLPRNLPPGAFVERFFVDQWNAFITVAATNAILRWRPE